MFGDKGYINHPLLQVPYSGHNLSQRQSSYNKSLSDMRVTCEWSFGKIVNIWAFIDFAKKQKLGKQPVGDFYKVATLLTNCHSCLYSNQTAKYYAIPTPDLEDYPKKALFENNF
jgi:hypothetical protein